MCSDLLCMSLFQSFNSFVILFELIQLLFEFLASEVETLFQIHHFRSHVCYFIAVNLLHHFFLLLYLVLVLFEWLCWLILFFQVRRLKLTDFFLPVVTFLSSLQSILLLGNNTISGDKQLLNLFFIGIVCSCVSIVVFLVFAVKMENYFS